MYDYNLSVEEVNVFKPFNEFGTSSDFYTDIKGNLHDELKQTCISNDSLAVTVLFKDFQSKIDCLGPLNIGILADTYEAYIG
jgi:hypothetical protein